MRAIHELDALLRLELRHYHSILALADTGSLTAAAERLGTTQSALSHRLREAERRLGLSLYTKVGRRLRITPAGECLLAAAREVLPALARAEGDALAVGGGVRHVVRIGSGAYNSYYWLPPLLKHFQDTYPDVDVQIASEPGRSPLAALLDGALDVAVASGPVETEDVRAIHLFRDELVLIVPPDHRLAGKAQVEPADLAEETYMTYSLVEEHGYESEHFFRPGGVRPRRLVKVELTEGIVELVQAGFGVSILSRWAVARRIESGALCALRVGRGGLYVDWHASVRRGEPEGSPAIRLAEELARSS
ncbi:LysR family transcriptional regulator [Ferruginivarius sediminum]|nr:LysR substrate-binding domain-containing protein [Ferruginivarius sediminum]